MGRYRDKSAMTYVRVAIATLGIATITGACAPPPAGLTPIGDHQSFNGYVNGSSDKVSVKVACSGLPGGSQHGRAVPGQSVEARLNRTGGGNTGDNGAVFVMPNTNAQFVQLRNWSESVEFPTDVDLPCSGRGTIVFDPCFGIIGCRGGARADVVDVTFVNIAP